MDELLLKLVSIPLNSTQPISDEDYDRRARTQIQLLHQNYPSRFLNNPSATDKIYDLLDPFINTLPYIYILNAQIDAAVDSGKAHSRNIPKAVLPEGALWPRIVMLLNYFDPVQVRYAGSEFRRVIDFVAQGAEQTSDYVPAIQLLQNVILRLDPTSATLTSTHYHFVRLCLTARTFSEGARILDQPIYHISGQLDKGTSQRSYQYLCSIHDSSATYLTPGTGLTAKLQYRDYLEYFLYGGMIYMAMKQWEKALFFLEVVIVAPTPNTASMVMVEAYKKWLLVGLLGNGKPPAIPKTANSSAIRSIKAIAKPYDCLADAFVSKSSLRLYAEIQEGQQIWVRDYNYALVVQVFEAFRKFAVVSLGKTFEAISIAEVARRTSPEPTDLNETSAYISSLISSGDLSATLTRELDSLAPPILRFIPSSSTSKSEEEVEADLMALVREMKNLLTHISDNDHRLEISKEYIEMLRKLKRQAEQESREGGPPGASSAPGPGNEFDIDEDMMGDI